MVTAGRDRHFSHKSEAGTFKHGLLRPPEWYGTFPPKAGGVATAGADL